MANQTRVAAVLPAIAAAITELSKASRTITQAPPQYSRARIKVGFSLELMKPGSLSVPQPSNNPHEPRTRKTAITKIEIRIALGRFWRGFSLSSASGVTDSQPLKAKIEKTTARYKPLRLEALAGSKEAKLMPPTPGRKNPQRLRTIAIATPAAPRKTIHFAEALMPR